MARPRGRPHRARRERPRAQAPAVRRRHHLRHQQRVRVRLPPRQHGDVPVSSDPAWPQLRDRRRGRLDPHRRGPHPPDHLGPGRRRGPAVLQVRHDRPEPAARRRLRRRRAEAHGVAHRGRHREGRGGARDRQPLRRRGPEPRPPAAGRPAGQGAVQARQGLHRQQRRGEDRRRVHRPHPRGPALVGGTPPGGGGQGGREDQGGEPDPRHDHPPELLPHVRQARRHDGHRVHGGGRVRQHVRPPGRPGPDQQAHRPRGRGRPDLQDRGRQVRRRRRRHRRALRGRPAGARRHHLGGEVREALADAREAGHRARGAERQAAHPRSGDRGPGGAAPGRDGGHQHGRSRGGHHPRWQPRDPRQAGSAGEGGRPRQRRGPSGAPGPRGAVRRGDAGRRATRFESSGASTSWARSGTSHAGSTTSSAAALVARATRARAASTSPSRTT